MKSQGKSTAAEMVLWITGVASIAFHLNCRMIFQIAWEIKSILAKVAFYNIWNSFCTFLKTPCCFRRCGQRTKTHHGTQERREHFFKYQFCANMFIWKHFKYWCFSRPLWWGAADSPCPRSSRNVQIRRPSVSLRPLFLTMVNPTATARYLSLILASNLRKHMKTHSGDKS